MYGCLQPIIMCCARQENYLYPIVLWIVLDKGVGWDSNTQATRHAIVQMNRELLWDWEFAETAIAAEETDEAKTTRRISLFFSRKRLIGGSEKCYYKSIKLTGNFLAFRSWRLKHNFFMNGFIVPFRSPHLIKPRCKHEMIFHIFFFFE